MRRVALVVCMSLVARLAHAAPFDDEGARAAFARTPFQTCGTGGRGIVKVTFEPDGHAHAEVWEGAYVNRTIACLEARFGATRVAPFDGGAKTIDVTIQLPPDPPPPRPVKYVEVEFDPTQWRHGQVVPPGFRPEHSLRVAPLAVGGSLVALGAGLLIADLREARHTDDETGQPQGVGFMGVVGGLFAFAGTWCLVIGLAGKDRLVRDPSATTWRSRLRPAIGPSGASLAVLF